MLSELLEETKERWGHASMTTWQIHDLLVPEIYG